LNATCVFRLGPYFGVAMLVAGLACRYLVVARGDEERSRPSVRAHTLSFEIGAWGVLVAGHVLAVLAPAAVLAWIASPVRLYLLELVALVAGLSAFAAWIAVALRAFMRSNGGLVVAVWDSAFLATLFVGVASGLAVAVGYRWGSAWGAAVLSPYIASVLTAVGAARAEYVARMPFLVQLHVVSFFGALGVFPFTSYARRVVVSALGFVAAAARAAEGDA
jgi:nitrate reductase gamma subunit